MGDMGVVGLEGFHWWDLKTQGHGPPPYPCDPRHSPSIPLLCLLSAMDYPSKLFLCGGLCQQGEPVVHLFNHQKICNSLNADSHVQNYDSRLKALNKSFSQLEIWVFVRSKISN